MKKNKFGFTLAEILLSLVIIGIIMTLSMNSIKIVKTSYTSLTYFALKHVQDMIGALYSGAVTMNKSDVDRPLKAGTDALLFKEGKSSEMLQPMVTQCKNSKGVIVNVLKTDGENYSSIVSCSERVQTSSNTNLFCKSLAAISNTLGSVDCSNLYSVKTDGTEPEFSKIDFDKPNFTLTNGMRFYISAWQPPSINVSDDFGYRLIAVDLNGKGKPNSISMQKGFPSDLVTFMVLDNGDVYPLGIAADNYTMSSGKTIQYLTNRVKGYYFSQYASSNDNIPEDCLKAPNSLYKCNFRVIPLLNENSSKASAIFTYREALCVSKAKTLAYKKYCGTGSYSQNIHCPPSLDEKKFDLCRVDSVKPAFRYNL